MSGEDNSFEEKIGQFEDVDDLDLGALIEKGRDALITEIVEYYDVDEQKKMRGRIYIAPISHGDWRDASSAATKNKSKRDLEELVCAKCWLKKDGSLHNLSEIQEGQKGLITAVYEKIKYISGIFSDPFEEKFLDRLSNS
ncbi:hypothetical protein [Methanobacterium sp.]|uniref:hypothetical protein n=1 Tax=Methanobacterium sp. TaxID=2164 RepID=UPI003C77722D